MSVGGNSLFGGVGNALWSWNKKRVIVQGQVGHRELDDGFLLSAAAQMYGIGTAAINA